MCSSTHLSPAHCCVFVSFYLVPCVCASRRSSPCCFQHRISATALSRQRSSFLAGCYHNALLNQLRIFYAVQCFSCHRSTLIAGSCVECARTRCLYCPPSKAAADGMERGRLAIIAHLGVNNAQCNTPTASVRVGTYCYHHE